MLDFRTCKTFNQDGSIKGCISCSITECPKYKYVDHTKNDPINKPSHYTQGGNATKPKYYNDSKITPWNVIDDWGLNYNLGTIVKYIKRAGKKDNNSRLQDLEKIRAYIDHEIELEKNGKKDPTIDDYFDELKMELPNDIEFLESLDEEEILGLLKFIGLIDEDYKND